MYTSYEVVGYSFFTFYSWRKTYYFSKHSSETCFNYSCDRKDLKPETLATFISWDSNRWIGHMPAALIALADVKSVWLDSCGKRAWKSEMLVFLQAWKAPIISPGLRSQPPIRCLKNNEWFLQHVGHLCFLFPEEPRLRIGCRDIMSFSPLSPIFPKLKTHRPERLNDVKQTLFTHICAPKCFFHHHPPPTPLRNLCRVNTEIYFASFHKCLN